jgi:hypothetical protein
VGGETLLLPSLDNSSALTLRRRHLVESSQESRIHAGEPLERWAVVRSGRAHINVTVSWLLTGGRATRTGRLDRDWHLSGDDSGSSALEMSKVCRSEIGWSCCCTKCCTNGRRSAQKHPKTLYYDPYRTTTYAKLGRFVIGRSPVQVWSSVPSLQKLADLLTIAYRTTAVSEIRHTVGALRCETSL